MVEINMSRKSVHNVNGEPVDADLVKAVNAVMEETGSRIEPATVERVLRFNATDSHHKARL